MTHSRPRPWFIPVHLHGHRSWIWDYRSRPKLNTFFRSHFLFFLQSLQSSQWAYFSQEDPIWTAQIKKRVLETCLHIRNHKICLCNRKKDPKPWEAGEITKPQSMHKRTIGPNDAKRWYLLTYLQQQGPLGFASRSFAPFLSAASKGARELKRTSFFSLLTNDQPLIRLPEAFHHPKSSVFNQWWQATRLFSPTIFRLRHL